MVHQPVLWATRSGLACPPTFICTVPAWRNNGAASSSGWLINSVPVPAFTIPVAVLPWMVEFRFKLP